MRKMFLLLVALTVFTSGAFAEGSEATAVSEKTEERAVERGEGEPEPTVEEQIEELRRLGQHARADRLATEAGKTVYWSEDEWSLPWSFEEVMDGADDPFYPGCVCCYDDLNCSVVIGRSVDECIDDDTLSENIADPNCTEGVACAKRKKYKCSELAPGSYCRTEPLTCCGVKTTSSYCELQL